MGIRKEWELVKTVRLTVTDGELDELSFKKGLRGLEDKLKEAGFLFHNSITGFNAKYPIQVLRDTPCSETHYKQIIPNEVSNGL